MVLQAKLHSQLCPKPTGLGLPDTSLEFAVVQQSPGALTTGPSALPHTDETPAAGINLKSLLFIYAFLKIALSLQPALLRLHLKQASAQKTQDFFFFFLYKLYF